MAADERLDTSQFAWTAGTDVSISHIRIIDSGASGEVHELYNSGTGQTFARKLIRPFGDVGKGHIENEVRAVTKLCKPGAHKNIVTVFSHGPFPPSYYFFDMELCDINLECFIKGKWTPSIAEKLPYSTQDSPSRMRQIWVIMEHITSGIAFIHSHGEIHRDLKPRNVLYSHKDQAWKIADFGLTQQGTSKRAHTTRYSRGTGGYRAPELLQHDEDDKARYTNKVDIWAFGCILYEVVYQKKAFGTDNVVWRYALEYPSAAEGLQNLSADTISDEREFEFVSEVIQDVFQVEAVRRPAAHELHKNFIARGNEAQSQRAPPMSSSSLSDDDWRSMMLVSEQELQTEGEAVEDTCVPEFSETGKLEDAENKDSALVYTVTNAMDPPTARSFRSSLSPSFWVLAEYIAINKTNTHVATVTLGLSGCLQQLWSVETGLPLRDHEAAYDQNYWRMCPNFSPDGRYAGFRNGGSCLLLVDTLALPGTEETDMVNLAHLSRPDVSFAIGPRGRCVALGLPAGLMMGMNRISSAVVDGRRIDFVPCPPVCISQHIGYTLSGKTLFLSYIESKGLTVRIFDVWSGNPEFEHRIDHVTNSICKSLEFDCDDDLLFLVHVKCSKPGPRKFGFLWRRYRREETRAIAINRRGIKTGDYHLSPQRQLFVSQYNALIIDLNGEVSNWDCRSASDEGVEHIAWTKDNQIIGTDDVVVAFKDRRLTLISPKGEWKFIDTE